jgi:peptide/nickel transport system ATP-binding protein
MTPPPIVEIDDLSVSFARRGSSGRVPAVQGISLTVPTGQTLAIVGESGSGKSVTALSIIGLLDRPPRGSARIDRGTIRFRTRDDRTIDLASSDDRTMRGLRGREIAMIFQEPLTSLNPVFSIGDQLIEAVRVHERVPIRAARDRAVQMLERVGIREAGARLSAYPHEFSGGMRQRVMIAMALACGPRLLLADEPTTALDVTVQAQILSLLRDLQREHGLTIVLITHALGVVAQVADSVAVMRAGRIVEHGPARGPLGVLASPKHPYTQGLLACTPSIDRPRDRLVTIADFEREAVGHIATSGSGPDP